MDIKICGCCKLEKNVLDFYKDRSKKNGLSSFCKICTTIRKKKSYYADVELSRKVNRERIKKERDSDRDLLNQKRRVYYKHKMDTDPLFKLKKNVRNRIWFYTKFNGKSKSTFKIIGISAEELKIYLESFFIEGMSWQNYGIWHIDHIIPLDSANNEKELYDLCHYTNLQPMWGNENIRKGSKILVL
jgi:hypothetical protein